MNGFGVENLQALAFDCSTRRILQTVSSQTTDVLATSGPVDKEDHRHEQSEMVEAIESTHEISEFALRQVASQDRVSEVPRMPRLRLGPVTRRETIEFIR